MERFPQHVKISPDENKLIQRDRKRETKHYVLIILPGLHAVDFRAVTHFYRVNAHA